MNNSIQTLTDSDFQDEVESGITLVKFSAPWCGPCKMITPILESLQDEFPEVKFRDIDIDANLISAPKYGVRGIPTMMLFRNGAVVSTKVGALGKPQLSAWLEKEV